MQVIRRLDTGELQSQIGAAMNLATSTIRTILLNKEKKLSSAQLQLREALHLEEMEKRLSMWIDDEIERHMPLNQDLELYLFLYVYSCRAASPLLRLVEGEDKWEASDHPRNVIHPNWGGIEQNRTENVRCLKLRLTTGVT
ncbi:hypothetical protein TNCV_1664751 [Trichonephila clavipes]|uniref:Uncharacterized protein n=1 Tax=Trichonephila clavipes TaxID=2585209 RepID=A0A8X6RUG3_TRICX|nr:hypothetical protein TNCV_1664751 [Trichonephila clavipes]